MSQTIDELFLRKHYLRLCLDLETSLPNWDKENPDYALTKTHNAKKLKAIWNTMNRQLIEKEERQ
jgi:cyclopropane fatty-acyl-phospholipid synthase-like methyltransferase